MSDSDLPPPPPGVPPAPGPPPGFPEPRPGAPGPPAPGSGGYGGPPPPGQPGQFGQPGQPGQPGQWGQPPAQPYVPGGPPGGYNPYGPPPAEPGKRIIARVIDFAILAVVYAAAIVLVVVVILANSTSTNEVDSIQFGTNIASFSINVGILVIYWLYESVMVATRGQTIGKMIMKLEVVDLNGNKLTMGASMKRALVWLTPLVPCCIGNIAFLVIEIWGIVNIFNQPDRRTLMDQFAGSTVTFT